MDVSGMLESGKGGFLALVRRLRPAVASSFAAAGRLALAALGKAGTAAAAAAANLRPRAGQVAQRAASMLERRLARRRQAARAYSARPKTRNRPGRAVREIWIAQLEEMGRNAVEDRMERMATPDSLPDDPVTFIDSGIVRGTHRFPSRQFVQNWLYEGSGSADAGPWRILVIVAMLFAAAAAGLLMLTMR